MATSEDMIKRIMELILNLPKFQFTRDEVKLLGIVADRFKEITDKLRQKAGV